MKLLLKYVNIFVFLISFFAIIPAYAIDAFNQESFFLDQNYKEIKLTDQSNDNSVIRSICTATTFTEGNVLLANYLQIIQINLDTGKTKILEKALGVDTWYPTGLKWHEETQGLASTSVALTKNSNDTGN